MGPFMVTEMLQLSCSASFADVNTTYRWVCSTPSCFAHELITQNVSGILDSMSDGLTINCTATSGDFNQTSDNFPISSQLYSYIESVMWYIRIWSVG